MLAFVNATFSQIGYWFTSSITISLFWRLYAQAHILICSDTCLSFVHRTCQLDENLLIFKRCVREWANTRPEKEIGSAGVSLRFSDFRTSHHDFLTSMKLDNSFVCPVGFWTETPHLQSEACFLFLHSPYWRYRHSEIFRYPKIQIVLATAKNLNEWE